MLTSRSSSATGPGWRVGEVRGAFRSWRGTRPFWAGLLTGTGGVFLVAPPLAPIGLMVKAGTAATTGLLFGGVLVLGGLFFWFAPHQRGFISLVCAGCSVLSCTTTNLGGFGTGMLLGLVGSSMAFGWRPASPGNDGGGAGAGTAAVHGHRLPVGVIALSLLAGPGSCSPLPSWWPDWLPAPGWACTSTVSSVPAASPPALASAAVRAPAELGRASVPALGQEVPTIAVARLDGQGLTVKGSTTLATASGPIRALMLHADAVKLTRYRLTTNAPDLPLTLVFDVWVYDVDLYATYLRGGLQLGALSVPVSVTPALIPEQLPLGVRIPALSFTDLRAGQALIVSPLARYENLAITPTRA